MLWVLCSPPVSKIDEDDVKKPHHTNEKWFSRPNFGLLFVKLDLNTVKLGVLVDAGFATNKDFSSQLRTVIIMIDSSGTANIIHYMSEKSKRNTSSVLAAELYSMVLRFDTSYKISICISDMFNRKVPLIMYTDSKSLYESLVRIKTTTGKRPLIDLLMLRQSYEQCKIVDVFRIRTEQNPANALTKQTSSPILENLMLCNFTHLTPNTGVERREEPTPISVKVKN